MNKGNDVEIEYLVKEMNMQFQELKDRVSSISSNVEGRFMNNKSLLHEYLSYEIKRIKRMGGYLSIICFRINKVEDIEGLDGNKMHNIIEDQVLRLVKKSIRGADILGKYGDNEYMIILPDLNPDKGPVVGNRLVQVMEREVFPMNHKVTWSMVVKQYEGESAMELINIARYNLKALFSI